MAKDDMMAEPVMEAFLAMSLNLYCKVSQDGLVSPRSLEMQSHVDYLPLKSDSSYALRAAIRTDATTGGVMAGTGGEWYVLKVCWTKEQAYDLYHDEVLFRESGVGGWRYEMKRGPLSLFETSYQFYRYTVPPLCDEEWAELVLVNHSVIDGGLCSSPNCVAMGAPKVYGFRDGVGYCRSCWAVYYSEVSLVHPDA